MNENNEMFKTTTFGLLSLLGVNYRHGRYRQIFAKKSSSFLEKKKRFEKCARYMNLIR